MNQTQDEQYLKLLSIFHYVVGGLAGLIACFPIIHLVIGIVILISSFTHAADSPGALFGLFFIVIAGSIIFFGWAFAICIAVAGRFLSKRKNYMFCLVMAGVECMFTPFGTVLGVFTIIILTRPAVREMFENKSIQP